MNKNLNIFLLGAALIVTQACSTKTEKTSEEAVAVEIPAETEVVLTTAEKRAQLEKVKAERLEKRRIEKEKLAELTPWYTDKAGNIVFNKSEIDPSYKGGNQAMLDYLSDNLKYPAAAQESGIEGTVFVDFVINKSGNVREVEVMDVTSDNVDQSFRDEAIRVVTSMPKWLPGLQKGKAVDVKFSIPITFQMI